MSRLFTGQVSAVAVTATQDFFEIAAPSTACVIIHSITMGQYTDFGDSQDELLSVLVKRGVGTTTGSGGTTVTSTKLETGSAAVASTVKANNTTKQTSGTITTILADTMNVRAGWVHLPTPETRIVLSPSERLTVEITAPADSLTMNGTVVFEEIGG